MKKHIKYIRKDYALANVQWALENHSPVDEAIERTVTEDVVPVVRCKDCKNNDKEKQICSLTGVYFTDMDFCSYGENKRRMG